MAATYDILSKTGRLATRRQQPSIGEPRIFAHYAFADKQAQPHGLVELDVLPNEILHKIFLECEDLESVLSLAAASRHFREVFRLRKVVLLHNAVEQEYGPISQAVQICTYSETIPAYQFRRPPISEALIKQVVILGKTANAWLALYPQIKWARDYCNRRMLDEEEAFRFRRALYRIWLYSAAYHESSDWVSVNRTIMKNDERFRFVNFLNQAELHECCEVHEVLTMFVEDEICPSSAVIRREYASIQPDFELRPFSTYLPNRYLHNGYGIYGDLDTALDIKLAKESWGEDPSFYVSRILRLTPDKLLQLYQDASSKHQRLLLCEDVLELDLSQDEPASLKEALVTVMGERGEEFESIHAANFSIYGGIVRWKVT